MGADEDCAERRSGLWGRVVWRKQVADGAVQPATELFEQVQAHILLAHLDAMQGRFREPQLPREVPVGLVPTPPSNFLC